MDGNVRSITVAGVEDIAVNATAVVYTDSFKLKQGMFFGLWVLGTSVAGTSDLKIQLEQSWTTPTTENAADTARYAIPEAMADIFTTLTAETAKVIALSPVPMTYARFKITGNAANNADTILKMKLFQQDVLL